MIPATLRNASHFLARQTRNWPCFNQRGGRKSNHPSFRSWGQVRCRFPNDRREKEFQKRRPGLLFCAPSFSGSRAPTPSFKARSDHSCLPCPSPDVTDTLDSYGLASGISTSKSVTEN